MKVLVMDIEAEGTGVDIALRAKEAGHQTRYWLPTKVGNELPYGDGLVEKPTDWKPSMEWAELIIVTGNNKYTEELAPYFGKGYPILGTNAKSAELELDRGKGQEILKEHGIETIPYMVVDSIDEGVKHIKKTKKGYAMKPWGGDGDSAMTCVAKTPDDAMFTLAKWGKTGKFKGQLMLQELCEGVEFGVAAWFGPDGWNAAIEECFEHKRFLTGDLGENTGEMGTVIRHVKESKLFDLVLAPLTDYLHLCKFVGDCSVNCIITDDGTVGPLEFTMRFGWPDFTIVQEVLRGDPVNWMADLLHGKDTLNVSTKTAVGVVMVHGDFPKAKDPIGTWSGYPIKGITDDNYDHLHFQQAMWGPAVQLRGTVNTMLTAGVYPLVVTGCGVSVISAVRGAYAVAEAVSWPSNLMYRTDIGKGLKGPLMRLQKHGFAEGWRFD